MRSRVLIIPAAGLGSRLGASLPKVLVPVGGVPMLDRLLAMYAGLVSHAVVVAHPSFETMVREHVASSSIPVTCVVQLRPTGMLDAILLALPTVQTIGPDEVWVTWCDQVGIHPATIQRLAQRAEARPDAALVMPTVHRSSPYIHLQRDPSGRIVRILHRREGDEMPEVGESDAGLFVMSRASFVDLLPAYAREVPIGAATGERNFLPFIAWVHRTHPVETVAVEDEMEAVGVNTPEELRTVEAYLKAREAR
jgi:bifunctional UDP-N-acetylglucosamine pyrophosphorylase / glucosamine-1-phosphate N-acetyltransferase